MSAVISLTTDFGLSDEYVGVMKGVILTTAPQARIVDLTHAIENQDLLQAAYIIDSAHSYFPPGTIHVVVVDPGVGSERRIILLVAHGQIFLAPDNGLLTLIADKAAGASAYEVRPESLGLHVCSSTFHGRDIFAPTAGRLATGMKPAEAGPPCQIGNLVRLPVPEAAPGADGASLQGRVVHIDKFGNLMTNIDQQLIGRLTSGHPEADIVVDLGATTIAGLHTFYGQVQAGAPLALIGSRGYLEISVNRGNAAVFFGLRRNDPVTLRFQA